MRAWLGSPISCTRSEETTAILTPACVAIAPSAPPRRSGFTGTGMAPIRIAPRKAADELDPVEQDEQDRLLRPDAKGGESSGGRLDARRELVVVEGSAFDDKCDAIAAALAQVPVDEVIT